MSHCRISRWKCHHPLRRLRCFERVAIAAAAGPRSARLEISARAFVGPPAEEAELVAIINSTRGDIVVEPASA